MKRTAQEILAEYADEGTMDPEVRQAIRDVLAQLARLVEAGDHLAREVSSLPWRPGEGHLADAVEMWRSVIGAQASAPDPRDAEILALQQQLEARTAELRWANEDRLNLICLCEWWAKRAKYLRGDAASLRDQLARSAEALRLASEVPRD